MKLARRIAIAGLTALLLACASDDRAARPHKLEQAWRAFLELPSERALAIAGDPRRGRWITTYAAGQATLAEAETAALSACRVRRHVLRMRAECVLYAVGDEVVWRGR